MEVIFIGATNGKGISKKSGKPYEMCYLEYAIPARSYQSDDSRIDKVGSEVRQIDTTPEVVSSLNVDTGSPIEMILSPSPMNPQRNICTGIK